MRYRLAASIRSALLPAAAGGVLACFAAGVSAQTLIFSGNVGVDLSEITVSGTSLQRKRADGTPVGQPIPASSVVRVDFPVPEELIEAESLIVRGKYDEALAKAAKVQDLHKLWKDKPGSWFADASLLMAEGQLRSRKFEDAARLISQIKALPLTPAQQTAVAILDTLEQAQKNMTGPALARASDLVKKTDDSQLLARLHLLIGDIQLRREAFAEALDAYLRIPVFYGSQAAYLPAAELGAARSLQRLKRTSDASEAYARITARYRDTPEAAEAKKAYEELQKAGTD